MCAVDMTVDLEIYPNISISNFKSDIALFKAQIFAFKKRINNADEIMCYVYQLKKRKYSLSMSELYVWKHII